MWEQLSLNNEEFLDLTYQQARSLKPEENSLWEDFMTYTPLVKFASAVSDYQGGPNQIADFDKILFGQLFELVAHFYLSRKLIKSDRDILLTPHEVQALLTGAERQMPGFGETTGVRGLTIADGMLLRQTKRSWQVGKIFEYKATLRPEQTRGQMRRHRISADHFREHLAYGSNQSYYYGRALHCIRPQLSPLPLTSSPKLKVGLAVPTNLQNAYPEACVVPVSFQGIDLMLNSLIQDGMWLKNH